MVHFGFSYIGVIYLMMLFIPNLIWAKNKPTGYELLKKEKLLLVILERMGEVLVTCCVLIFSDFNIRLNSWWILWLVLAFIFMILYEAYWFSYFNSNRDLSDFYKSFCNIPVAGATLPVLAAYCLAIYGSNIFLFVATFILGIGHIRIHKIHQEEANWQDEIRYLDRRGTEKGRLAKFVHHFFAITFSLIVLCCGIVIGIRNYIYITNYYDLSEGIEESTYVKLNGQKQYVLIRGTKEDNPVMIWLHGGPGSPDNMISYLYTNKLVDDYTVVAWDQRGCGRTYFKNFGKSDKKMKVDMDTSLEDLNDLVDYCRKRFSTQKVILVGHSYGSLLGSEYIKLHPEKVSAYVGVGQYINANESEKRGYEKALERAKAAHEDTSAMTKAYEKYEAEDSLENLIALRNETARYLKAPLEESTILAAICSPYFGVNDFRWFAMEVVSFEQCYEINKELYQETFAMDLRKETKNFEVPVGFISGSEDYNTNVEMVEEYYETVHSPYTSIHILRDCGHFPQVDCPTTFTQALKEILNRALSH